MGKGDTPRPVDRAKWDNAAYWKELERRERARKLARKRARKKGSE